MRTDPFSGQGRKICKQTQARIKNLISTIKRISLVNSLSKTLSLLHNNYLDMGNDSWMPIIKDYKETIEYLSNLHEEIKRFNQARGK